jgi:hypothetical protein
MDEKQKKRGRPKKAIQMIDDETEQPEIINELILYLPIYLKDLDETIEESTNEEKNITQTEELDEFDNSHFSHIHLKTPLIETIDGNFIVEENTKISCWWCSYTFDTSPVFIPERFYNDKFHVFGCFCCYNCAVSYIFSMNDYKVWDRYSLLKKMFSITYGKNIDISMAPEKEIFEKFGGCVSIDEWRKNSIKCTKEYRLVFPPMIPIIPIVEIRTK